MGAGDELGLAGELAPGPEGALGAGETVGFAGMLAGLPEADGAGDALAAMVGVAVADGVAPGDGIGSVENHPRHCWCQCGRGILRLASRVSAAHTLCAAAAEKAPLGTCWLPLVAWAPAEVARSDATRVAPIAR